MSKLFFLLFLSFFVFTLPIPFSTPPNFLSKDSNIPNLSNYPYPTPSDSEIEYIVLIGTNDFHGNIIPMIESTTNSQNLRVSGLSLLSSYLDALSDEWQENLLWLDAGDQFQGSIESNSFGGEPMVKFINSKTSIQRAATIGNHDFDFGYGNLTQRLTESHFEHVTANIFNIYNDEIVSFPNTYPSKIYSVGGIKIGIILFILSKKIRFLGIIGLTTQQTPFTTATDVSGLLFKNYRETTMRESKELRSQGADIIVLLSHIGMRCNKGDASKARELQMWFSDTPQPTNCTSDGELMVLLNELPEGVVDAVIGGHTHEIVHHFFKGIPVVIAENLARYLNVIYLPWDKTNKRLIREKVAIEGPVPICERLPPNEKTCFSRFMNNSVNQYTEFLKFKFHGKIIEEDTQTLQNLGKYIRKGEEYRKSTLATIDNAMFNSREEECGLGDYVCDALINYTKAEICIFNKGAIRINWEKGALNYYELFQTFPFDNAVVSFELTGEELKNAMKILQNGKRGFYHTSGLRQEVCGNPHELKDVKLIDGKEIEAKKNYKIVSNDFLTEGGDDFREVLAEMQLKSIIKWDNVREVIEANLVRKKEINSERDPVMNQKLPRLIVLKEC